MSSSSKPVTDPLMPVSQVIFITELGRQVGGRSEVTNCGIRLHTGSEGLRRILASCRTRIRRGAHNLDGDSSRCRVSLRTREDLDM